MAFDNEVNWAILCAYFTIVLLRSRRVVYQRDREQEKGFIIHEIIPCYKTKALSGICHAVNENKNIIWVRPWKVHEVHIG